jgi:hypothetical protein
MGTKKIATEGGSGGGRGHSNMEHWFHTDEIKHSARKRRRRADAHAVHEQLEAESKRLA